MEAGLPPAIEVAAGGEMRLPLPSAAGGGYLWRLEPLEGAGVADLCVETGPSPRPEGDRPASGAAPLTLVARGLSPGEARWRLELVRPWAKGAPLTVHELTVTVREPR